MSNEELNQKMDFIVEHQAKFAADIEIMREVQAKADTQLHDLSRAVITVEGLVGELTEAPMRTNERLDSLSDIVETLTLAQMRTDERLNSFISVVERHIAGNGGPSNPS